ncbi:MAG: type II toxin-antitoxin system HicB family antitoxin [Deltaproteobacteria bacterium]|nr:type II toxin-antitoxin system HicB family antitoxin [Deltaproteobacteria bacterium]
MAKRVIWIPVVVLKGKTGYSAFSPAVEGCVATDKTIDRTLSRMKEALEFHIEGLQLLKQSKRGISESLKRSFEDYGEEALYASLRIAA